MEQPAGWTRHLTGTASERYRLVAGDSDVASIDELTGDDFSSATEARPKNLWLSPAAITVAVAVVASFVAARSLLGSGSLVAPALLPAHDSIVGLWRTVVSAIPGAPAQVTPPWEALAALASTALFGQPEWFTTLLLCGVVPLSLLAAYPLARRVINDRRVRLWVCGTYALLPVLLGGTNQGRLALSVVAIGLPLLVMAARALVLRRTRTPEAWRGGWGAGVVLVALVAFEPSMIIFAVLVGILGAIVLRRSPRKIGRIGIALGVPLRRAAALVAKPDLGARTAVRRAGLGASCGDACSSGVAADARPRRWSGSTATMGRRCHLRRHLAGRASRTCPPSCPARGTRRLGSGAGRSRHGCRVIQTGGFSASGGHRGAALGWQLSAAWLRRIDH